MNKKSYSRDYETLELKCGLEFHQQLATKEKLFCRCPNKLSQDKPLTTITRYMRPTMSELGEYDKAAIMEFKKQKEIIYEIPPSVCTYEIDETPPFPPNSEAIDIALTISKLLDMRVIDELHVNRKQYLDGSIPSGFQRTMIVGVNGSFTFNRRKIKLSMLALEEDSCREIESTKQTSIWRTDRLGIPLVEITTKTFSLKNPEEIEDIALTLGRILRATGKVKRGIGTIRQDLNVSIKDGSRVELKGIQELEQLPDYVTLEVERQIHLLEIQDELKKRSLESEMFSSEPLSCNKIFEETECDFIRQSLEKDHVALGVKLPRLKGLLDKEIQAKRTFRKEIEERVEVIVGLDQIFYTDELLAHSISKEEKKAIEELFDCTSDDIVAFIIGPPKEVEQAIIELKVRLRDAFDGVPNETRHANEDGTSKFQRYLGGANRMYPDTDSKPIPITPKHLQKIADNLPELPRTREKRYRKDLQLPDEIAKNLAISTKASLFDDLVKMGVEPITAAVTLEQTLKALKRDDVPIEKLTDERIKDIFGLLVENKITKDALEDIFTYLANNPSKSLNKALDALELHPLEKQDVIDLINKLLFENKKLVLEKKEKAFNSLMGELMDEIRGQFDGQKANELLKEQIENFLETEIDE